eukprot:gene17282-19009_t
MALNRYSQFYSTYQSAKPYGYGVGSVFGSLRHANLQNVSTSDGRGKAKGTHKNKKKKGSKVAESGDMDRVKLETSKGKTITKIEEVLPLTEYVAIEDYVSNEGNKMVLNEGDVVEVLDTTQDNIWLVRRAARQSDIGFVTPKCLRKRMHSDSKRSFLFVFNYWRMHHVFGSFKTVFKDGYLHDMEDSFVEVCKGFATPEIIGNAGNESPMSSPGKAIEFDLESTKSNTYIAIANYDPKDDDELAISEGTVVDVMEGKHEGDLWVVRTINDDGTFGEEGLVPSAYLEKDAEQEEAVRRLSVGFPVKKDERAKEKEALNLRDNVLKEIVETERKYVEDLRYVCENHVTEVEKGANLPPAMVGKQDVIFANIKKIYMFHNRVFLHEMEACLHDSEGMAQCFVRGANKLETLYVEYCRSRPMADDVLNRPEVVEYWENFQQNTEDPHFLQGYLITPVQRITRYQLLLKVLLKYSTRANQESATVELALTKTGNIIRLSNDMLHVSRISGYKVRGFCS